MTVSATAIDRNTADGAREDLERYNKELIANSRAENSSHIVRLEGSRTLTRLQKACKDFEKVDRAAYRGQ